MNLSLQARQWLNAGLGFFYPEICQVCRAEPAQPAAGYVGAECRAQVRRVEPPWCGTCGRPYSGALTTEFICANCRDLSLGFSFARSAVLAKGPVLEAIHAYKYNGGLWFEPFLAGLLLAGAQPCLDREDWDVIVPVPLHPTKHRERGFNQALELARHLSRATGIPLCTRAVRRAVHTETQTRLTRAERLENVKHAFRAAAGNRVRGARVVLLDDVFTTGATTSACGWALLKAGARDVCVWTLARGL